MNWFRLSPKEKRAILEKHTGPRIDLARRFGVHPDTIYDAARNLGLPPMGPCGAKEELREKIKALVKEGGRSYTQMAKLLGVTKGTVAGQIDRMGLTGSLPSQGPQRLTPSPPLEDIPDDQPLPGSTPATLEHVSGCRWPVTGGYCNDPLHDKSFCAPHALKARPSRKMNGLDLLDRLPFRTSNAKVKQIMNSFVHDKMVKYRIVSPGEYLYYQTKTPPE